MSKWGMGILNENIKVFVHACVRLCSCAKSVLALKSLCAICFNFSLSMGISLCVCFHLCSLLQVLLIVQCSGWGHIKRSGLMQGSLMLCMEHRKKYHTTLSFYSSLSISFLDVAISLIISPFSTFLLQIVTWLNNCGSLYSNTCEVH